MKWLRGVLILAVAAAVAVGAPISIQAQDLTVNLGGFSPGQMRGLRATFFAKKATVCRDITLTNLIQANTPNTSAQYDGNVVSVHLRQHAVVPAGSDITVTLYSGTVDSTLSAQWTTVATLTVPAGGGAGTLILATPTSSNAVTKFTSLFAYGKQTNRLVDTGGGATVSVCIEPSATYVTR